MTDRDRDYLLDLWALGLLLLIALVLLLLGLGEFTPARGAVAPIPPWPGAEPPGPLCHSQIVACNHCTWEGSPCRFYFREVDSYVWLWHASDSAFAVGRWGLEGNTLHLRLVYYNLDPTQPDDPDPDYYPYHAVQFFLRWTGSRLEGQDHLGQSVILERK